MAALIVAACVVLPSSAFADATVTTGSASPVSQTQATLNGTVDPEGVPTDYHFEYGTDISYGSETGTGFLLGLEGSTPVDLAATGLTPNTEYHYRLIASQLGAVVATGEDQTFTTLDVPSVSAGNGSVGEGTVGTNDLTFTVSLSAASDQTVTVDYATADGSATQPADYAQTSGTLTFAPGETSKSVTVQVNGDTLDEADETFTLGLSNAGNATIADASGTGTITDDDPPVSASIDDVTVTEGDSGTASATFTVTLSAESGRSVSVDYGTADAPRRSRRTTRRRAERSPSRPARRARRHRPGQGRHARRDRRDVHVDLTDAVGPHADRRPGRRRRSATTTTRRRRRSATRR